MDKCLILDNSTTEMIASLLWNRDSTLNGQVFDIRQSTMEMIASLLWNRDSTLTGQVFDIRQ